MSTEAPYASATVHLLDRDTQTSEKAMVYPVTRVELMEIRGDALVTSRIFVVNDAGLWVEAA